MVTQKLIDEHKGRIEVASDLNAGTTFTVRLPYEAAVADSQ
jgi:signal transduction histidine kinase